MPWDGREGGRSGDAASAEIDELAGVNSLPDGRPTSAKRMARAGAQVESQAAKRAASMK